MTASFELKSWLTLAFFWLPIERGQLGLQRLDAAPPTRHRQRERARHRWQARTGSSQALQPAGNGAQLSDERLSQAGNHAGCTLLIIGHQLSPLPARGTPVPATTRSFLTPRQVTPARPARFPVNPARATPVQPWGRAQPRRGRTDRRTGA